MVMGMATLDLIRSRNLLLQVVQRLYSERHSPLPGALVKAQMLVEARNGPESFDEAALGYRNFLEFLRTEPGIAIQTRAGSDMLLAPAAARGMLSAFATEPPRLRRDFWRAFIEFPIVGTVRLYDQDADQILYEQEPTSRNGVPIDPIRPETQLEWRRQFALGQPEQTKTSLLAALSGSGTAPFNEFARRLRENPALMLAWNRYLQKQVTDQIAAWGDEHGIAEDRWAGGRTTNSAERGAKEGTSTSSPRISHRAELYNFFDKLPLEELLKLRVPLEWVLKTNRE